ncbi:MAG: DMT family transporter [Candidatus Omnitrophica bacterium]|nr:DMT family transporter [Candidatus Omnitrophota bacterium]
MWFTLSLFCAFFTATTAALTKILIKDNDEFLIGWLRYLICLPLFAILFVIAPKPRLDFAFWKNVFILLPLELGAFLLFLKSIKISPLSLTFPFLGLTPVFSILAAYLFLGERVNHQGVAGIMLIAIGAYLLNADLIKKGVLEPIKKVYTEKGSMLMIMVAFIYSITSILGKKGVLLSSPTLFPLVYYPIFLVVYTIFIFFWLKRNNLNLKLNKFYFLILILSSLSFVLGIMFHFKAISMIEVPYMISVKRMSLLFSVLYGAIIFKEKNIRYRLIGASVMVAGVLVLVM